MSTINASTGYSPFQLHMGRSPHIIPPLLVPTLANIPCEHALTVEKIINSIHTDVTEAKDNLIHAKVTMAHPNELRGCEEKYEVGNLVMLSTLHRRQEYKWHGEKCVAKFFPCFDGLFEITDCHPKASTYTLDMPNTPNMYHTYHTSELKRHVANDPVLFPSCKFSRPGPVLAPGSPEEFHIDQIINSWKRGQGNQYLVRWTGYGPEHDHWLPGWELEDCEALDRWLEAEGHGSGTW